MPRYFRYRLKPADGSTVRLQLTTAPLLSRQLLLAGLLGCPRRTGMHRLETSRALCLSGELGDHTGKLCWRWIENYLGRAAASSALLAVSYPSGQFLVTSFRKYASVSRPQTALIHAYSRLLYFLLSSSSIWHTIFFHPSAATQTAPVHQDLEDDLCRKSQCRSKMLTTATSLSNTCHIGGSFWAPSIPSLHEHRAKVFRTGFTMPSKIRPDLRYIGSLEGAVSKPGSTRCPAPPAYCSCTPFLVPTKQCFSPLLQRKAEMSTEVAMHQWGVGKIASAKGEQ